MVGIDYAWMLHAFYIHMAWIVQDVAMIRHGLCVRAVWVMHGLCMGYVWIVVNYCMTFE